MQFNGMKRKSNKLRERIQLNGHQVGKSAPPADYETFDVDMRVLHSCESNLAAALKEDCSDGIWNKCDPTPQERCKKYK
jgi:hypothetical protein